MNALLRALLRSRLHRLASGRLMLVAYDGRRTGTPHELPVMYADDGDRIVVFAANASRKRWWRNFDGAPHPARVRRRGAWRDVSGRAIHDNERVAAARAAYTARFPRAAKGVADDAVLVEFS